MEEWISIQRIDPQLSKPLDDRSGDVEFHFQLSAAPSEGWKQALDGAGRAAGVNGLADAVVMGADGRAFIVVRGRFDHMREQRFARLQDIVRRAGELDAKERQQIAAEAQRRRIEREQFEGEIDALNKYLGLGRPQL